MTNITVTKVEEPRIEGTYLAGGQIIEWWARRFKGRKWDARYIFTDSCPLECVNAWPSAKKEIAEKLNQEYP